MQNAAPHNSRLSYVPLHEASAVLLHRNACVQLRSRYAACRNCERICPTGALQIRDGKMSAAAQCLGCGRCMAACPTGALQVRGFFPRLELPAKGSAVRVDCLRAPKGADVRVPCLGGLSVSRLLALRVGAGERELELLDRGWCAGCPSGKGAKEHPVAKSLGRAQARLRDAGLPERLLPRLKVEPLPQARKQQLPIAPNPARRSLMTGFARALQGAQGESRFLAAPAPERARVLSALAKLSERYGGSVSAKLFHTVEIEPGACHAHGVCAAGCPSGALRAEAEAGSTIGLSHSATLCIGCGHCERVCPEKAVRLVYGAGDARVERRIVARFQSAECSGCGARITRSAADDPQRNTCERCAKRSALARAAFQQFHGSRAADGI